MADVGIKAAHPGCWRSAIYVFAGCESNADCRQQGVGVGAAAVEEGAGGVVRTLSVRSGQVIVCVCFHPGLHVWVFCCCDGS